MPPPPSPTPLRCLECEVEWQADDECFLCGRHGTPGRVAPIVHPPATAWPGPAGRPAAFRTALARTQTPNLRKDDV
jgi:hypothetical protein